MYICDVYQSSLCYSCQRHSNNSISIFIDEELLTVYLFCGYNQRFFEIKPIHTFAKEYLLSWFPKLPSYKTFNKRLNMLSEAFKGLLGIMAASFRLTGCDPLVSLADSMPIAACRGKNRTGKVARKIADEEYYSTKNMYYYGVKLHVAGYRRQNSIPYPEMIVVTPASENDLTVFKRECAGSMTGKTVFGDKIYADSTFFNETSTIQMLTPCKVVKGEPEGIKKMEKAVKDLYSQAVSRLRQPIEAFFNWLNEKTEIQRTCKVRTTKGLLVHIFGKLAIAMLIFIFYKRNQ